MFALPATSRQTPPETAAVSRRAFLTAGALGMGGWALADLLRAEEAAGLAGSRKAVIQLHLDGGPSHLDMIDLKPEAPSEIRGEFQPIATSVPGLALCELLPKVASAAHRFAFLRGLVGADGRHDAFQCQSGFRKESLEPLGGRPALGCVLSKLQGSPADAAPAFIDLMQGRPLVRNSARPGFLGPSYKPFRPDISRLFTRELEEGMKNELAAKGENHTLQLTLSENLGPDRLAERNQLLRQFDGLRREWDSSGMMAALDRFHLQAANILTSGKFAAALDLAGIPEAELARYTAPESTVEKFVTGEDHHACRKLLMARRLIEAGARCVSVSLSDFDTHRQNFPRLRQMLPILDHGLHALVGDLEERGLLDDVLIVAWGEFGRTPKINASGGRDHWPQVAPAILAGGGLRVGQALGRTDRTGSAVTAGAIDYQDVVATIYHHFGVDPRRVTLPDSTGRPQYLLDHGAPIAELV